MATYLSSRTIAITCDVTVSSAYSPKTYTYSFPADPFSGQVTEHAKRKYARDNKIPASLLQFVDTACSIACNRTVDSDINESITLSA